MQTFKADPLDEALGARIRAWRKRLGVSQGRLADSVGVTFQQIQKYERGTNRISFSALVRIARALDCRVKDLIDDLDDENASSNEPPAQSPLSQAGAGPLLENYGKIRSPAVRQALLDLSRKLATGH
jgi:transcriptional regulator with XRE-family HTH domain